MDQKVVPEGNSTSSGAEVDKSTPVDGLLENNQKLRKEKENWKQKAVDLENQLKIKLDAELAAKEEWKTLAEQRLKETEEWKGKYLEKEKIEQNALKIGELKKELNKLGMDMKFMDAATKLIDLKNITIDQESGVVLGAESAAKALRETMSPLFQVAGPNVSHAAPQEVKAITLEEWRQLTPEEKIKREGELFKNLGIKIKP